MVWTHDDHPRFKGYIAALVHPEGVDGSIDGYYRELRYPTDDTERTDIVRIQAACTCGWRSPYMVPERGTCRPPRDSQHSEVPVPSYSQHTAWVTEPDLERCRKLWHTHVLQSARVLTARQEAYAAVREKYLEGQPVQTTRAVQGTGNWTYPKGALGTVRWPARVRSTYYFSGKYVRVDFNSGRMAWVPVDALAPADSDGSTAG